MYNGSFIKALKDVFPHIDIQEENFARLKRALILNKIITLENVFSLTLL